MLYGEEREPLTPPESGFLLTIAYTLLFSGLSLRHVSRFGLARRQEKLEAVRKWYWSVQDEPAYGC